MHTQEQLKQFPIDSAFLTKEKHLTVLELVRSFSPKINTTTKPSVRVAVFIPKASI